MARPRRFPPWAAEPQSWADAVARELGASEYRTVFNLTGTVLHSNLGRALPAPELFDAVRDLVTRPMSLEYELGTGRRGDREAPVTRRLTLLTGADAATVVNNNAAALLLALNTLAQDRAVPVSRGELVEIGGSFRLPELMARAGCRLLEVGTTNRTHPDDYRDSAGHTPALLLKVHPSNYQIRGFSRSVSIAELADIARSLDVPLIVDLGSGSLVDLRRWGLPHEPTPAEVLAQGADLVTFSGDKLLGGVQAGLIVGRSDLVAACRRNPMKRALRADKITLALLDRTLALYEAPEQLVERLPLLRTLTLPLATLNDRAGRITAMLGERLPGWQIASVPSAAVIGSGALPETALDSVAVTVSHADEARTRLLQARLRGLRVPVIGRLQQGTLWLDMRGADPLDELLEVLGEFIEPGEHDALDDPAAR